MGSRPSRRKRGQGTCCFARHDDMDVETGGNRERLEYEVPLLHICHIYISDLETGYC